MVTVTFENGEFKFHGTFDCGYAGLYRDDRIRFPDETPESIRENGLQDKDLSNCDDDAVTAEVAPDAPVDVDNRLNLIYILSLIIWINYYNTNKSLYSLIENNSFLEF